jgi:hypothetical protein
MRALAFLSVLLVVEGATAGTTVPVEPQLVAPAEVEVATAHEGVVLDVQTTPGLVANWTAPASLGSGSATFAFDVSSGRLTVASAGSFVVSGAVPSRTTASVRAWDPTVRSSRSQCRTSGSR